MTCPKCNHGNDADARFCENCGAQLLPAKTKHFIKAVQALALAVVWMIPYATAEAQQDVARTTETPVATSGGGGYGGLIILFIVCMIVGTVVTKTLTKKKKNKTTSPMTCPMCNYVNDADARFCENCGAQLKRNMKPFVKVLLALALLVVGGMVPFMPPLGLAILFFIACMAACIIITKKLTEKKKNKNT